MDNTLRLKFTSGGLSLKDYTSLDISRHDGQEHITLTNATQDLAFNRVYNNIQKKAGNQQSFQITVKRGKGKIIFDNMTVAYYLNADCEMLTFSKRIVEPTENQNS